MEERADRDRARWLGRPRIDTGIFEDVAKAEELAAKFGAKLVFPPTSVGLSADLRRQLTETKIEPAAEGPEPLPPVRQAEATSARSTKNKRAQVDR